MLAVFHLSHTSGPTSDIVHFLLSYEECCYVADNSFLYIVGSK
jgi:hypothetical protein